MSPNKNYLIYILDDENEILDLLEDEFRTLGYKIQGFNNLEKFYHALEEEVPHAVITDLVFDKERGSDVVIFLNHQYPDIDVFVISGFLTPENQLKLQNSFIKNITAKPFPVETYAKNFHKFLSGAK